MHAYDARPLRLDLSTPTSTSSTTPLRESAAAAAATGPLSSRPRQRHAVLERVHEHGQATSSRSQSSQDAAACAGCAGGHSDDDDCRRRRRRRPRERQAGGALLLALAIYAQAPNAAASPIAPPESAASPSRLAGDHRASPTVAPTRAANFSPAAASSPLDPPAAVITHAPRPRLRERGPNIPPLYVNSDGEWVQDYGWTLRGRVGTPVNSASTGASTAYATAMEDHIPTASPSTATAGPEHTPDVAGLGVDAGALSSSSGSTFSSTPTSTAASSSSSSPSISIPNGWQAIPRETNYYAVPLVIAMSILVAVLVAISIFISVIVRRKKRRRRKAAAARKARRLAAANGTNPTDLDGTNEMTEKGWRGAFEKVTGRQARRKKRKAKRAATRVAAGAGGAVAGERTEGEEEGSAGRAPSVRRRVRVTGFTAAGLRGSLRRRRRRNGDDGEGDGRGGGDAEEEEDERALTRSGTRSSTASVVENTLTHRVATRLSSSASGARGAGTTTVFSRDARNGSVISLTASALDRVGSRSSRRSTGAGTSSSASIRSTSSALLPPPPHPAPEILFTPADDPTLPDHLAIPGSPHHPRPTSPQPELSSLPPPIAPTVAMSPPPTSPTTTLPPPVSSFGAMIATDSLPAPGPPAYRPSSSTVQRTRRFADPDHATTPTGEAAASRLGATRRRLRRQRRESEGTSTERGARSDDNDEGEWHWPGEKGRPLAVSPASAASTSADPFVEEATLAAGDLHSAEEDDTEQNEAGALPPIDRSLFSAHVATDDKAVLARLRQQRERSPFVLDDEEADVGMMTAGGSSAFVPVATSVPVASAPPVADDADVDEDGFERYDVSTPTAHGESSSTAAGKVAAGSMSSLLPAPPRRVHQVSLPNAFTPASHGANLSSASSTVPLLHGAAAVGDERSSSYFPRATTASTGKAGEARAEVADRQGDGGHDEEDLPMYLPGSTGASEALRMASAPFDAEDHSQGEDDGDDGDGHDSVSPFDRGEEREEEGIV